MATPGIYAGRSMSDEIGRRDRVQARDRIADSTHDFIHAENELVG
jgi:hypothetical protein